jgi:serine O-acetyltransferase
VTPQERERVTMQPGVAQGVEALVDALARSVDALPQAHRIGRGEVPEPEALERALEVFRWICFPGFHGPRSGGDRDVRAFLAAALHAFEAALAPQLMRAIRSMDGAASDPEAVAAGWCRHVLALAPSIRELLVADAQEALAADPAARSLDEIILCYPGLQAMLTHRLAHALHALGVPLVPRMLAEISHRRTGIDIHPGASIGPGLFIDHGTGVVIGETTRIGKGCRIYQGVTLGALTPDLDRHGSVERGQKRHPTLGDRVVVYAGATILGGDTVIGEGSTVNGGVFLTQSVPAGSVAQAPRPEVKLKNRG